jgi:hypothetical protein
MESLIKVEKRSKKRWLNPMSTLMLVFQKELPNTALRECPSSLWQ